MEVDLLDTFSKFLLFTKINLHKFLIKFMKVRLKDHDYFTKVFQINANNINEEKIDLTDKFKDCSEIVDRSICEKINFGEKGMFYLSIQDGYSLKNIETHSINSFLIN